MMTDTNVGKWTEHYRVANFVMPMGDSPAYRMGAVALKQAGCETVEDWGCGYGWFEVVMVDVDPMVKITAVDGSQTPRANIVDDLVTRRTSVDGIFMRSVLEHNYNWEKLLANALGSFTKRMVLETFTPFQRGPKDKELRFEEDFGVPTLSLSGPKLKKLLAPFDWSETEIESPNTAYGVENIFVIDRG
jgi:hypothetical protein